MNWEYYMERDLTWNDLNNLGQQRYELVSVFICHPGDECNPPSHMFVFKRQEIK